jgi:hypothetical protein
MMPFIKLLSRTERTVFRTGTVAQQAEVLCRVIDRASPEEYQTLIDDMQATGLLVAFSYRGRPELPREMLKQMMTDVLFIVAGSERADVN